MRIRKKKKGTEKKRKKKKKKKQEAGGHRGRTGSFSGGKKGEGSRPSFGKTLLIRKDHKMMRLNWSGKGMCNLERQLRQYKSLWVQQE